MQVSACATIFLGFMIERESLVQRVLVVGCRNDQRKKLDEAVCAILIDDLLFKVSPNFNL